MATTSKKKLTADAKAILAANLDKMIKQEQAMETAPPAPQPAPQPQPQPAPAATAKAATMPMRITHSYRLFALLKKQKGIATTEELAAATGLKPMYVSWYMAELKRVYGVDYEHRRGDPLWKVQGDVNKFDVPPSGVAGKRRGQSTQPVKTKVTLGGVEQDLEKALQAAYQVVLNAINREFSRLRTNLAKARPAANDEKIVGVPMSVWRQMKKQAASRAATHLN